MVSKDVSIVKVMGNGQRAACYLVVAPIKKNGRTTCLKVLPYGFYKPRIKSGETIILGHYLGKEELSMQDIATTSLSTSLDKNGGSIRIYESVDYPYKQNILNRILVRINLIILVVIGLVFLLVSPYALINKSIVASVAAVFLFSIGFSLKNGNKGTGYDPTIWFEFGVGFLLTSVFWLYVFSTEVTQGTIGLVAIQSAVFVLAPIWGLKSDLKFLSNT